MSEHTVRSFDQELADLNALVLRMGGLVQEQIDRAMQALRDGDVETARNVVARDHVVNFMDVEADERSVNLLARRQPMGRDLRMIIALGKAVSDLERIGDEAERIARMAIHLLGGGRFQAYSAGSHPAGAVNAHALALLERLGYAVAGLRSKSWDALARAPARSAYPPRCFAQLSRRDTVRLNTGILEVALAPSAQK